MDVRQETVYFAQTLARVGVGQSEACTSCVQPTWDVHAKIVPFGKVNCMLQGIGCILFARRIRQKRRFGDVHETSAREGLHVAKGQIQRTKASNLNEEPKRKKVRKKKMLT